MAKVQVGFKFRPDVDARLKELAAAWGITRTAWLEDMILSFDLESEREAAQEELAERKQAVKASVKSGRAEGERLVERVRRRSEEQAAAGVIVSDAVEPAVLPPQRFRPEPDKIAAAQDWLKRPKK